MQVMECHGILFAGGEDTTGGDKTVPQNMSKS